MDDWVGTSKTKKKINPGTFRTPSKSFDQKVLEPLHWTLKHFHPTSPGTFWSRPKLYQKFSKRCIETKQHRNQKRTLPISPGTFWSRLKFRDPKVIGPRHYPYIIMTTKRPGSFVANNKSENSRIWAKDILVPSSCMSKSRITEIPHQLQNNFSFTKYNLRLSPT